MLEIGLVGGVGTLRERFVKSVCEVELVKLGADGDVSDDESKLSEVWYSLIFSFYASIFQS